MKSQCLKKILAAFVAALVVVLIGILMLQIWIDLSSKPNEQIIEVNDVAENCELDSDESLDAIDKRLKIPNEDPPPPPGGPSPGGPPNFGGAVTAVELKKSQCQTYTIEMTITGQAKVSLTDCDGAAHQIPISANLNCVGSFTVWPGCEVYMPSSDIVSNENACFTLTANNAISGHISIGGGGSIIHREDIPVHGQLDYFSLINACRASDDHVRLFGSGGTRNRPTILTTNNIGRGFISIEGGNIIDCEKISIYEQSNRVSLIDECYTSVDPAMSSGGGARNRPTRLMTNSISNRYTSMVECDASGDPMMSSVGGGARNRPTVFITNGISNGYTSMVKRDASVDPVMSSNSGSSENEPIFIAGSCSTDYATVCDRPAYTQENREGSINTRYASVDPAMSSNSGSAENKPVFIVGSCSTDYYATVCAKPACTQ